MNFTLNGRTVSVESVNQFGIPYPADVVGVPFAIAVSVDGNSVGTRPTMADALALATVWTAGLATMADAHRDATAAR